MKTSKYLLSIILISAAMLFIGEMYSWHLSEFEVQYPSVTFYSQKGISQEEMTRDIINTAKEKNVGVFVVDHNVESYISEEIKIYGTEGMEEFIQSDAGLEERNYSSIFLGDVDVSIDSFENIPDISKFEIYRVIGDSNSIVEFKQALVNKYAGSFPKEGYEPFNIEFNTISIWMIVFILIIMLTIYQVILTKKEMVIRFVSGENIVDYIRKKMILESMCYGITIIVLFMIWNQFTHITYKLTISMLCIFVFMIINPLCYLYLKRIDYKSDIYRSRKTKRFLSISYVYKTITVFLTVLIVSSATVLISDGVGYYQQKGFFLKHMDKSYVMMSISDEDFTKEHQLKQNLYDELDNGDTCTLVELTGFNGTDNNYVYADKGAVSYLKNIIPEVNTKKLSDKAYIISPSNYKKTGNVANDSEGLLYSYSGNENILFEKIVYKENIKIIAQNGEDGVTSGFKKNPVIILNNMDNVSIDDYVWQGMMINVDKVWGGFISKNNLDNQIVYKTNVFDNYMYNWQAYKRGIMLGIILTAIMMFIESLIIRETLRFEYSINAVEISLKRVFGYGITQTYGRIVRATLLSGIVSIVLASVVSIFVAASSIKFIILAGCCVLSIEILFVIYYIRKIERLKMQRVLKGDIL